MAWVVINDLIMWDPDSIVLMETLILAMMGVSYLLRDVAISQKCNYKLRVIVHKEFP